MLAALLVTPALSPAEELRPPLRFGQCLRGVAAWCGVLIAGVLALHAAFPDKWTLTQSAFSNWDAEHYLYIRMHGYDEMRTAFFPLFPLLWRWLNVSPIVAGLLNLALFAVSFATLAWQFQWPWRIQALLLTVPSLMFMALPYTEAVFFASGTMLLLGLHRQNAWLYCVGLILSCTSRAAAFVLLPAVFATFWLVQSRWPRSIAAVAAAATIFGLAISMMVHRFYTGQWLAVFAAQRFWGNHLQWPTLPLRNWAGSFTTRFEGPPLLIGLGAAIGVGWLAWHHWRKPLPTAAQPTVFALAYLGGVTALTLATRGGLLVSLSRYLYATPYFLLVLARFMSRVRLSNRHLWVLFGLMELVWLGLFGAYTHIRTVLGYSLVSGLVLLWLLNAHQHPQVRRLALLPTLVVSTGLMLYLLMRFLSHEWVA